MEFAAMPEEPMVEDLSSFLPLKDKKPSSEEDDDDELENGRDFLRSAHV